MRRGASLDGKATKPRASKKPKSPVSSSQIEPLQTLSRKNLDIGLRPASPPKTNPWVLRMKHNQSRPGSPSGDPPLPAATRDSTEDDSSKKDSSSKKGICESCRSKNSDSLGSGSETIKPENDDQGDIDEDRASSPVTSSVGSLTYHPTTTTSTKETPRSVSTGSMDSRRVLLAAAPRAEENLWNNPVGADVEVYAGTHRFLVHRDVITRYSGWFRDNLPPPSADGSPISMRLDRAPEAIGYCLRFMYTRRIEICDDAHPLNEGHLPRCVLGYCSAVFLRVPSMVLHILRLVEKATTNLPEIIRTEFVGEPDVGELKTHAGVFIQRYLRDALDLIYSQRNQDLMRPMRMVVAQLLDTVLLFLLRDRQFVSKLFMTEWQHWIHKLLHDQIEYRRIMAASGMVESLVPSEAAIEALLDNEELREWADIII